MKKDVYSDSGVDIGAEQSFVKAFKETGGYKELPGVFAKYLYLGDLVYGFSTDGVGSKLLCYVMKGDLTDSAHDLEAMLCNDIAAEFIKPMVEVNYVAVNRMNEEQGRQMGSGRSRALAKYEIFDGGGESATLIDQIKEGTLDWAGFVWGLENASLHKEWIAKRDSIGKGIAIVGLEGYDPERNGYTYQSNGATALRRLLEKHALDEKVTNRTLIEELTAPSMICSDLMVDLRDKGLVHFFVPVTGGGYTNIIRILHPGIKADIEFQIRENTIFEFAQQELGIEDSEMYRDFNRGHVILIGTDKPGDVIDFTGKTGRRAREIGQLDIRKEDDPPLLVNGNQYSKY